MTTKIQKWGNSLAIRIPNEFAKNLNWGDGAIVDFQQLSNSVVITSSRPEYTLEQMLKSMTKKNKHKLVWTDDKKRGKEVW